MALQKENDDLKKKNAQLRSEKIKAAIATERGAAVSPEIAISEDKRFAIDNAEIILYPEIIDADIKELLKTSQELLTDDNVLILGGTHGGRANIVIVAGKNVVKRGFKSSEVVKEPSVILGGGGGGRPERAQGGGQNMDKIDEALKMAMNLAIKQLKSL
jgi:alanyl-tRNA synthetase